MKPKSRPLFLFYILVVYVLLQSGWWSYLLAEQNREIYLLKRELNLQSHADPQLVIEKGNELEARLRHRTWMIAGEGLVFIVLLIAAFLRVRSTFRKEAALAVQQNNFLLSVTHELKSPVASLRLQLETLQRRELEKERQKDLLSSAIADTDRLNTLVENILLAAKIGSAPFELNKEPVNLSEYVEECLRRAVSIYRPEQEIAQDIQPNISFAIDKTIFPSVLFNLFENAVKYSPPGSTITITLRQQGNGVILSVADEGAGVPDREQEKIFRQFYRLGNEETRKTKGTGLGLYIVRSLLEKHNGKISVRNNRSKGSVFEVILHE